MLLRDLNQRHVVIWGAGTEGRAAAELVKAHTTPKSISIVVDSLRPNDPVTINDIPVIERSSERGVAVLGTADIIVKSPGVSPHHGGLLQTRTDRPLLQITGGTDLWFSEAGESPNLPLSRTIVVTGSKGKSTTASLIAHLLSVLVRNVVLAGNVGRAPLDVLAAGIADGNPFPADRWHVFELSSFQTAEVRHSPAVSVLTALFPEHLDWHLTVDCYYADKINLFQHEAGSIVVNVDNPTIAGMANGWGDGRQNFTGELVVFGKAKGGGLWVDDSSDIIDGRTGNAFAENIDIPLVGRHNSINVCGALSAISAAGFDLYEHRVELVSALRTFVPLAYRLESLGECEGRVVIDDGLSTAPQAAIVALAAFNEQPVGILIGGHDRGLDYEALAAALASRATSTLVVTVPESGLRIGELIRRACALVENSAVVVEDFGEFDEAVLRLKDAVAVGGVILLSPAAPSFGSFRDYKDRSKRFRSLLGF